MGFRSKKQSEQLSLKQVYEVIDLKITSEIENQKTWQEKGSNWKKFKKSTSRTMDTWYDGRISSLQNIKLELELLLNN